jgi:hypothetical protein
MPNGRRITTTRKRHTVMDLLGSIGVTLILWLVIEGGCELVARGMARLSRPVTAFILVGWWILTAAAVVLSDLWYQANRASDARSFLALFCWVCMPAIGLVLGMSVRERRRGRITGNGGNGRRWEE